MEVLLQYLDDLDDLFGMLGLMAERLRSLSLFVLTMLAVAVSAYLGTGVVLTI